MRYTTKQLTVLAAIDLFISQTGYSPTVRELAAMVGLKSPSTLHGHLTRLRDHGAIQWDPERPRTIVRIKGRRKIKGEVSFVQVPVLKLVAR